MDYTDIPTAKDMALTALPALYTYATVATCSYRDEVRRYEAISADAAAIEAADRYGHEATIGVDPADVTVQIAGIVS